MGTFDYLIPQNKDVTPGHGSRTASLVLNGKRTLRKQNKTEKTWSLVGSVYNASTKKTSASLTIDPGDIELIRVEKEPMVATKIHFLML